jgi:hypothetical protein
MPGYLEAYGSGEEKREKLVHRILIVVAVVLVAGTSLYFTFRNYRETRQAEQFFQLLRGQDYKAAYALWGCTESAPCSEYTMQKFMEDWGPKSSHADLSSLKITHTRGCDSGVIIEASFGSGVTEYLWVDRAKRNLGFAPWPVCNPRLP